MPGPTDPRQVIVAAAQTEPVIGEVETNLTAITATVTSAAASGARLVVLPELCTTGYMFAGRQEALAVAEPVPSGPTTQALAALSRDLDLYLVAGVAERSGYRLYNSAVLLGPAGHIGTYRKLHLWDKENTIFEPGDAGLPVFQTPIGTIGLLICYDAWFPEAFRALALQGADAVCLPTNWVPIPGQQPGKPAMALSLCQAAGHVNSMHVIAADRVGTERGQPFIGQSVVIGPTGWPLAGPASSEHPDIVMAATDITSGRSLRHWNEHNDPITDRRPSAVGIRDDHHVTDPAELTSRLIRLPSGSATAGQQDVFDLAAAELGTAGFSVRADIDARRRFLLARSPHPGPMLLFACHVDTVPAGDAKQWTHDPLGGEITAGRVHGRGASDMKGGLAAAITALASAASEPRGVSCGLLLTTDEEIGCLGAAAAVAAGALTNLPVGAVIIPESTANEIRLGHRGALWLSLTARGHAAHGSTPELGRNALLALARALIDIEARLPRPRSEHLGTTSVNVAAMSAGEATNIVPDLATARIDIRYVESGQPESIRAWLAREHPVVEVSTDRHLPPVLANADDPWIRSLPGPPSGSPAPYFTDASMLLGALADTPLVIWGPGRPELAHAIDEYVEAGYVRQAAGLYGHVLEAWRRQS